MTAEQEKRPTGYLNDATKLRKLIGNNPELPLLVFVGEDANRGDYNYMVCANVDAYIGEYLDCQQTIDDEYCYTDRNEFRNSLENHYADSFDGSDKEFESFIDEKMLEYEPYWKKCIIVRVDS